MNDTVFIRGITALTIIGVYNRERHRKQRLIIDLELSCDTRQAGSSDNFEDALDYDAITSATIRFVESTSYQLIEAVAEKLAEKLIYDFGIKAVTVSIEKPGALTNADTVGVRIRRQAG